MGGVGRRWTRKCKRVKVRAHNLQEAYVAYLYHPKKTRLHKRHFLYSNSVYPRLSPHKLEPSMKDVQHIQTPKSRHRAHLIDKVELSAGSPDSSHPFSCLNRRALCNHKQRWQTARKDIYFRRNSANVDFCVSEKANTLVVSTQALLELLEPIQCPPGEKLKYTVLRMYYLQLRKVS